RTAVRDRRRAAPARPRTATGGTGGRGLMDEERLIDERALRRALRLDADERPPRLDAAALRAMAERPSTSPWLAMVAGTALALIAVAAAAAGLRVAVELAALVLGGTAPDFAV